MTRIRRLAVQIFTFNSAPGTDTIRSLTLSASNRGSLYCKSFILICLLDINKSYKLKKSCNTVLNCNCIVLLFLLYIVHSHQHYHFNIIFWWLTFISKYMYSVISSVFFFSNCFSLSFTKYCQNYNCSALEPDAQQHIIYNLSTLVGNIKVICLIFRVIIIVSFWCKFIIIFLMWKMSISRLL